MSYDFLGSLKPSVRRKCLLKAALLDVDAATKAHRSWRDGLDLDAVEGPDFRILPLLAANLARCGIQDPDMPRLRGIRRQELYRNRTRFHGLQRTLQSLNKQGVPVMALKGAAICLAVRNDWSVRHMSDIDLLVPSDRADEAWEVFEREGWSHSIPKMSGQRRSFVRYFPNAPFHRPDGSAVDLHWRTLWQRSFRHQEESYWKESREIVVEGVHLRVLSHTHQLLQILGHGALSLSGVGPEWITDSFAILQSSGDGIDWEQFVAFTRERRISRTIAAQLRWLRDELGAAVPDKVLATLASEPPGLLERSVGGFRIGKLSTFWLAVEIWGDPEAGSWPSRCRNIVDAWGWFHGVPPRELPSVLLRKTFRRLRRRSKA